MRDSRTYVPRCCGHSRIWRSCAGVLGGNVLRTLSEHLDACHAGSRNVALPERCSSCVLALPQPTSRIEGRYLLAWTCWFFAHAVAVELERGKGFDIYQRYLYGNFKLVVLSL